MSSLNKKEVYVNKKLRETIFSEESQSGIIKIVLLSIKMFNDDYIHEIENLANYTWKIKDDESLAKHLLIMFEMTKKIPLNQIDMNEFELIWNQYIESDEYYLQTLNYIVNSDDYIFGNRFKLVGDSEKDIRESNYLSNAMQRWEIFKENPHNKSAYYGKLMAMARELNGLINKKY